MKNISNEVTNDLQNTIAWVSEIILDALIFLLAMSHVVLVLTQKTFRSNKLNWPTVNIALSTAIFSLLHLTFTVAGLEKLSIMSCRLQGFLMDMTASYMMYSYCVSSFNRLLAIRYFNKLLFRSSRWLLTSIAIGWIVAVLSAVPHALYDTFACLNSNISLFFKIYTCVTTIILPILIVTICNISIFHYIHQVGRRIHERSNNKNNNNISRKRDSRVSKMMCLTFCLLVIGWTPILLTGLFLNSEHQLPQSVSLFFELLLPISLLGDIILLIYTNQPVRRFIEDKLKCNGKLLFVIEQA